VWSSIKEPIMSNGKNNKQEDFQAKFNQVCKIISEEGLSLRKAVKGIMSRDKFDSMCADSEENASQYARAREDRADKMFEEILEIADSSEDDIEKVGGEDEAVFMKKNRELIERTKIRIDARKWMLGKMMPKKYSDKLDITTNGESVKNPISLKDLSDEQLDRLTK